MVPAARRLAASCCSRRGQPGPPRSFFTVSEFSKSEIVERLAVPPERVRVIAPGVTKSRPASRAAAASRARVVLFVGSIFNRRRLPDLIAAFARYGDRRPDARLVIVGADRTYPALDLRGEADDRAASPDELQLLDYVDERALQDSYARATVFAFLSEYEGFGLTPLEALAGRRADRRARHTGGARSLRRRGRVRAAAETSSEARRRARAVF